MSMKIALIIRSVTPRCYTFPSQAPRGRGNLSKQKPHILFTQSRGYSDIKFCRFYKNNKIYLHMKPTIFIRQTYLQTLCIHDWKFYLDTQSQCDALWARGRHPIFTWIWQVDRACQDNKTLPLTFIRVQGSI